MTREDIRKLVEDTVKSYTSTEPLTALQGDDLLILLLLRRLLSNTSPADVRRLLEIQGISSGCGGQCACEVKTKQTGQPAPASRGLILEEDVISLRQQGCTTLRIEKGTIITPLAADKARDLGMELIRG